MEISGWIFLAASWGCILCLTIFSLVRTICEKDEA
jgi:hypothetical protein